MGKVKTIIIYILSVVLAYVMGIMTLLIGVISVSNDARKELDQERNRNVSYRSYRERT